jgi:hypothetical protein
MKVFKFWLTFWLLLFFTVSSHASPKAVTKQIAKEKPAFSRTRYVGSIASSLLVGLGSGYYLQGRFEKEGEKFFYIDCWSGGIAMFTFLGVFLGRKPASETAINVVYLSLATLFASRIYQAYDLATADVKVAFIPDPNTPKVALTLNF